ncbi:hypothetical protein CsSME_00015514 [Camellia sinensis var. sinensis]
MTSITVKAQDLFRSTLPVSIMYFSLFVLPYMPELSQQWQQPSLLLSPPSPRPKIGSDQDLFLGPVLLQELTTEPPPLQLHNRATITFNLTHLGCLMFFLLKSSRDRVIPEFQTSFTELFEILESEFGSEGKASFNEANDQAAFNFLSRSLYGTNPVDTKLGIDGPNLVTKWVVFQLGPLLILGLPKFVEELVIHTFRLPPALVKKDYQRLYDFFYDSSTLVLDEAERIGISREEACHNLIFATCFNSFGGMQILLPNMIKRIGRA